ncbi:MAG: TetR/AcrR family transcriptional regulator [Gammaproteobacteria bacterium]
MNESDKNRGKIGRPERGLERRPERRPERRQESQQGRRQEQGKGSGAARHGGRPTGDDPRDVRAQLLVAARDLFTRHGFDAVSTRKLAAAAETTPAMIHYYFGDKHGLYRGLLEEVIPPVLAQLEARADSPGRPLSVAEFMHAYMSMFRANPWLPKLVFSEIEAGGEGFQRHFAERFASRAKKLLGAALERERAAGKMRAELDTDMALISVMSLCVFPFLARPMLERVLGKPMSAGFMESWSDHASDLFARGADA